MRVGIALLALMVPAIQLAMGASDPRFPGWPVAVASACPVFILGSFAGVLAQRYITRYREKFTTLQVGLLVCVAIILLNLTGEVLRFAGPNLTFSAGVVAGLWLTLPRRVQTIP